MNLNKPYKLMYLQNIFDVPMFEVNGNNAESILKHKDGEWKIVYNFKYNVIWCIIIFRAFDKRFLYVPRLESEHKDFYEWGINDFVGEL